MSATRVNFLGVDIDLLTMAQTVARAEQAMRTRVSCRHVALNVAKFVKLRHDSVLRADVVGSDIVGVDGMGIVIAARWLGLKVPERVTGVDLMQEVIALCAREGFTPYFLGARSEVLQAALANIMRQHPALEIAGARDGYFSSDEEPAIVAEIARSGADCLFLGIPTPAKERFLARHRDQLDTPFIMGVGGSIDVIARYVRRAPLWMQRAALEWLFRVIQEPRRMWKRYLVTNAAFAFIVATAWLRPRSPVTKA